jgi:hypothetical protein
VFKCQCPALARSTNPAASTFGLAVNIFVVVVLAWQQETTKVLVCVHLFQHGLIVKNNNNNNNNKIMLLRILYLHWARYCGVANKRDLCGCSFWCPACPDALGRDIAVLQMTAIFGDGTLNAHTALGTILRFSK